MRPAFIFWHFVFDDLTQVDLAHGGLGTYAKERFDPTELDSFAAVVMSLIEQACAKQCRLVFELTGDFELGSEPIVFVSMSSIRNWYQI